MMKKQRLPRLARLSPLLAVLAFLPCIVRADATDFFSWGNVCTEERNARWAATYGSIPSISGDVHEKTRPYYTAVGRDADQSVRENYSLADFNIDGGFKTYGVKFDKDYEWFGLHWNMSVFRMSTSAKAKRDYYLTISDNIKYNGHSYDHLMIPGGSRFDAKFSGFVTDLTFDFTPCTISWEEWNRLAPFVEVGLVAVIGQYDIHAGKPHGTVVYQNPPETFVVGGSTKSLLGVGAPQFGFGAEHTLGWDDGLQWINRLGIDIFKYDGRTDVLTSSQHRKKHADLSFATVTWDSTVMIPLESLRAIEVGMRIQFMDFDGSITSDAKDNETIISRRERFNKDFNFDLLSMMFFVGFTY